MLAVLSRNSHKSHKRSLSIGLAKYIIHTKCVSFPEKYAKAKCGGKKSGAPHDEAQSEFIRAVRLVPYAGPHPIDGIYFPGVSGLCFRHVGMAFPVNRADRDPWISIGRSLSRPDAARSSTLTVVACQSWGLLLLTPSGLIFLRLSFA